MEVGNEPPHILPTDQLPPVKNDHNRRKALDNIAKTIERFGDTKNISFILCLLQKRDDFIYPGIKRLCCVNYGVRSQCLLLEKALNQAK
jgi:eukaryotic translation initiation factor 2C